MPDEVNGTPRCELCGAGPQEPGQRFVHCVYCGQGGYTTCCMTGTLGSYECAYCADKAADDDDEDDDA